MVVNDIGVAVGFIAWVVVELRVRAALVDRRMLAGRGVWTTDIAAIARAGTLVAALRSPPADVHAEYGLFTHHDGAFPCAGPLAEHPLSAAFKVEGLL
ncbi:hypothetical protein [Nonomuraea sp. JJY05]|uniref:hypothetical protein n=1 Tax=Nonomuraea sp. JJY05 TaxID=3350255 RepID=UPI00373E20BC